MTSMPASRSARAMIFAPRSCPSRPGLATTTRILRAMPETLDDERVAGEAMLARHAAQDRLHRVDAGRPVAAAVGGDVQLPAQALGGERAQDDVVADRVEHDRRDQRDPQPGGHEPLLAQPL